MTVSFQEVYAPVMAMQSPERKLTRCGMRNKDVIEDWIRLSAAAGFLWLEAATVIWLRTSMLVTLRPGSRDEAIRMVAEKFKGNADLAMKFAAARPKSARQATRLSINHYGSLVRANRKRLVDRRLARRLVN
ncbi:MAG: hypothetical protein KDE32_06445 [Novosphingobium sp.]|nr:hypothetical protein [Novosphingobium sp.]